MIPVRHVLCVWYEIIYILHLLDIYIYTYVRYTYLA